MAITAADILVKLGVDGADQLKGAMQSSGREVSAFSDSAMKAGGVLTAGLTVPLLGIGAMAFNAASDLNEAGSAVSTVFRDSAGSIFAWAEDSATAFGLSESAAYAWSSNFGQIFVDAAKVTTSEAANLSQGIIELGADLASFNNKSPDEALIALRAGLTGEFEPLKTFGIFLSAAEVEAKALEMGLVDATGAVTDNGKVVATQALIMEKAGVQMGDFARTSEGAANKERILRAQIGNLASMFGSVLLPAGTKVMGLFSNLIGSLGKTSPHLQKIIVLSLGLAAALGPVLVFIGAMAPGITMIGVALGVLFGPLGLILIAIAAIGIAYKTNFLGFADAVNNVAGAIGNLAGWFTRAFGEGEPISTLVQSFPGPLQEAARGFLLVADALGDLWSAFQTGGLDGLLDALPGKLGQIGDGLRMLASEGFSALAGAISSIDWGAVWAGLGTIGSGLLDLLGPIATDIGAWAIAEFDAVNWGDVWTTVSDIGRGLLGKLGAIAADVAVWAGGEFAAVNWSSVWATVTDLGRGLLTGLGSIAVDIGTWAAGEFAAVDWGNVWASVRTLGAGLLEKLGPIAVEIGLWAAGEFQAVNWGGVWDTVVDLGRGLISKLGSITADVATWAAGEFAAVNWGSVWDTVTDLGRGLLSKLGSIAVDIGTWAAGEFAAVDWGGAIGDLSNTLIDAGTALIGGLVTGATNKWPEVSGWIAQRGPEALTAIGDLAGTLLSKGTALLGGLLTGAINKWPEVSSWIAQRGPEALSAIGDLSGTLWNAGWWLMRGLYDGVDNGWGMSKGFLAAVAGYALDAIGDLSGTLWNAGWWLMRGLYDGITSGWGMVSGLLGSITDAIPFEKGPPERDRSLLYGAGLLIMQGFSSGLADGWLSVERQLRAYSPSIGAPSLSNTASGPGPASSGAAIGATLAAANRGSGGIHIENLTIDVATMRELTDLMGMLSPRGRDLALGTIGGR